MQFPKCQLRAALFLASLFLASTGCVTSKSSPPPPPSADTLRSLNMFDGESGARATWETLQARIDAADIVVIGELHGHPMGLPFMALLFEESLERNADAALALEFVCRDRQYMLDAYLAGLVDLEGLEEGMAGSRGNSSKPHAPMIAAAREAGRPVIGANAPRLYTSTARKRGYAAIESLGAEQQRLFDVPPVMPSGGYRERFFDMMRPAKDETPEESTAEDGAQEQVAVESEPEPPTDSMKAVFRSQSLWDSTMSASASRAVDEGNRPVFLVVGQFHCDREGGTLQLLHHRQPNAKVLVISVSDSWSDTLVEDDKDRADFIVYVGPFPEDDDDE